MSNMVWKDFMGRVLQEGDDIIVAANDRLYSGIIHSITESELKYSYNYFILGKEYVDEKTVQMDKNFDHCQLLDICILNRK